MLSGPPPYEPQRPPPAYGDRPSTWWLFWNKQKIRLRHSLTLLILSCLAATGGWFIMHKLPNNTRLALLSQITSANPFTIRHIIIRGQHLTDKKIILLKLGTTIGQPFFGFSLEEARQRINNLPFVEHAIVERHLPDTIIVTLVEHLPIAIWQTQGRFVLINQAGEGISSPDLTRKDQDIFNKLPLVVGQGANIAAASIITLMNHYPALKERIVALVRIGERRWNIILQNGIIIMLPEDSEDSALEHLTQYQQKFHLLDHPIPSIDMRLPDRMIIHLLTDTSSHNDPPTANGPSSPSSSTSTH